MLIVCEKIGEGTEQNPFRPKTDYASWEVVEERETEFVIRVKS